VRVGSQFYRIFLCLGGGFQGFMSASDYLVDSIYWLPYYTAFGILGFVFGTSYNATVPALLNKLENRKDIQPPSFAASQIILVVIVNIVLIPTVIFTGTILDLLISVLPTLLFVNGVSVFVILLVRGSLHERVRHVFELHFETIYVVSVGAFFAYLVVVSGVEQAERDLRTNEALYKARFSYDELRNIIVLRTLDKGLIYRKPDEKIVHFEKWSDVTNFQKLEDKVDTTNISCRVFKVYS
jgi:hypothetical protein